MSRWRNDQRVLDLLDSGYSSVGEVLDAAIELLHRQTSPASLLVKQYNDLVVPYTPFPALEESAPLLRLCAVATGRLERKQLTDALLKLPRLRGAVRAQGFDLWGLVQPRPVLRIEELSAGRYDSWRVPNESRRERIDIADVLEGRRRPAEWLVSPRLDRRGLYDDPSTSRRYCELILRQEPWTIRFVEKYVREDAPICRQPAFRHLFAHMDRYVERAKEGR